MASKLGVKSGSDLVIASAAHLQLVSGQASFIRKEVLDTMKSATTYYNANMSSNLTKMIDSLITGKRLNQLNQSDYSLTANELATSKAKLLAQ